MPDLSALSPADLLRAAATRIRETAQRATPGPWEAVSEGATNGVAWINAGDIRHAFSMHGFPADAAHIALWSPPVALAVADWLDAFADLYESSRHRNRPVFGDYEQAAAVARLILGGEQ